MGMPAPDAVTTIEDLLALPEDGMRHELLDGEHVVTPAPAHGHQRVLSDLYQALLPGLADQTTVEILWSPADLHLGPRTLVQPDLFVLARQPPDVAWKDVPVPYLVIEALSPSTAARDRNKKRRIYLDAGVEEYWIADTDARVVERWQSGDERPEIVDGELNWSLSVGVSGSIDLPRLFQRVHE
jgi:Uma2 family endonuclease